MVYPVSLALRPDLGVLPSWIEALATVAALVFAALAGWAALRTMRIELDRQAAERRDAERRQAETISTWWAPRTSPAGASRAAVAVGESQAGAVVRNGSAAPVYNVWLRLWNPNEPDSTEHLPLPVLPPGDSFLRSEHVPDPAGGGITPAPADLRAEVAFTDVTRVRWLRDEFGELHKIPERFVIWADGLRATALRPFADSFLSNYGVRVEYRTARTQALLRDFVALARRGSDEVPDVLVGPHDWLGELVRLGAIEPITLSERYRARFLDAGLRAMTHRGTLYGIPYAMDAVALLRNTDLVPEPPATFEELVETGRRLVGEGRVAEVLALQVGPSGDPYHLYPLFTSGGGTLFGRADGAWDTRTVGLDDPGSLAAFERLRGLGERGERLLRRDVGAAEAVELFARGRTAFLLCASRAVSVVRERGVPFAVTPPPPFAGGAPARTLVSAHGFFLPSRSRNHRVARDLVTDYLSRRDVVMALFRVQVRPPALRQVLEEVVERDAAIRAYCEQCETGELMPAFAGMGEVWAAFGRAEAALVGGAAVEATARRLAQEVRSVAARR